MSSTEQTQIDARAYAQQVLGELSDRSREIFRHIVDAYVETGEPIGSRTLSRRLGMTLSPASIRNIMADLEEAGLLFAPHTSAGRMPTDMGLRMFVHGLLEVGDLSAEERQNIEAQCATAGRTYQEVLDEASTVLSGLSSCAGLVVAPKSDRPLKHFEFVNLAPGRALAVLVNEDGIVENRVLDVPPGLPVSALMTASNYLNARLTGRTLSEAREEIRLEVDEHRAELDSAATTVVEAGLATWAGGNQGTLIVKGQAHLLNDITAVEDLARIRRLFEALETKEAMLRMVESAQEAEGIQIFIGAESTLFSHTGCSMIIAPYRDRREQIVGAIGVIGPTRINYARIIPMVDYTAKLVGRLLWNNGDKAA